MFYLRQSHIFVIFCLFAKVFAVLREVNDDDIDVVRNIQMTGIKDGGVEIVLKTNENVTYFAIQYNVTRNGGIHLLAGSFFKCGQLILQDDNVKLVEGDLIEYSYSMIIGKTIFYSDYKIYVIDCNYSKYLYLLVLDRNYTENELICKKIVLAKI